MLVKQFFSAKNTVSYLRLTLIQRYKINGIWPKVGLTWSNLNKFEVKFGQKIEFD